MSDVEAEDEEKRNRGQPADISGKQWDSLIKHAGKDWIDAVRLNKKTWKGNALNKGLAYLMAKYGVLDPWRKCIPDAPEPKPGVVCADDTSNMTAQELKAVQDKMRKSINRAFTRYAKLVEAGGSVKIEEKTNEAAKTFSQILQEIRADKSKIFVHQVVRDHFWQPEWTDELEAEYVAKCSAPSGPNNKVPLRMNVKREFLLTKLEDMDEDTKAKVEAKVAELQEKAQEGVDKTLNINTVTPEDCARFVEDMDGFADRFVDILAQGSKGVVLLMVACPTVEEGEAGVAVKKWEWSSIPPELGRAGLSYSEVDVKMFRHMVERFRAFGQKVYDANFTKEEVERGREEVFDDLLEWQTSIAAAGGHGIMAGQTSKKSAARQHPGEKDRSPKGLGNQAPHGNTEGGGDAGAEKPRRPRKPSKPKARAGSDDSTDEAGSGGEEDTDSSHGMSYMEDDEDLPVVVEDDEEGEGTEITLSRKRRTMSRAVANIDEDAEIGVSVPRKRGASSRPLVIDSDEDEEEVEDEDGGRAGEKGSKGKAPGVKSGGASKPVASAIGEQTVVQAPVTAPPPGIQVGAAEVLQAPFTQEDETTEARKSKFKSIFYGLDPRTAVSNVPKAADVNQMLHEKIKALTYVPTAQPLYALRRVERQRVGRYALLDAYLEFESTSPPAAERECEGWAEIEVNGEEQAVRPAYMREWAASAQKCTWVGVRAQDEEAADDRLDWNFGAALLRQWVELQPAERRKKGRITRTADEDMDWGKGLDGGKFGARTLVIALLLWADAMADVMDGTSEDDWDRAAADLAQVLRVRGGQIRAREAVTEEKRAEDERAKGGADVAPAGRERVKSKTLAYMEANGRVDLPKGLGLGGGKAVEKEKGVEKKKVAEKKVKAVKAAEQKAEQKAGDKRKEDSETVVGGETSERKVKAGGRKRAKLQ
ncbi:hypothetical protein PENSPDRAFT_680701 [Peniophora sp. CONT]|nr:hypothetical protein PENSPDRAFT_680701 [Peniophora sp. CONT]